MPTIFKPKRKSRNSYKSKLRAKLYSDTQYRKIRDWYYQTHPLCEMCLKENKNKTAPSIDIHHKISPFQGDLSMEERYSLLRDENNFIALCRECHEKIHGKEKVKGTE